MVDLSPLHFRRKAPPEPHKHQVTASRQTDQPRSPAKFRFSLVAWLQPPRRPTAAIYERYVLPRFGSYRLARLPADEIENWLNDELDAGLAASSVHRHYRTLRRMLQVAVEKQKIQTNPCDRVDPPRVPNAR